jgi:metal-dependent amidase/aminoacylase/carboxypeptidase family protein
MVKNIKAAGVSEDEIRKSDPMGSSDLGNVGHAYPTVNLMFKMAPKGTALHSDAMREAAATDQAWTETVKAAKAVALTAYQLLNDPAKVKSIQGTFKEMKAKEGK